MTSGTFRHLLRVCSFAAVFYGCEAQAFQPVRFEPYEYDYQRKHIRAELGRFEVPEQYDHPNGRKIKLAFLRLKSTSRQPGPPVIYLAGGPGGSAIRLAKGPRGRVFLAMREAGDVIALEQRGVGLSQPNLDCPGPLSFPLNSPGDRKPLLALLDEKSRACAALWRSRGVELAAYNVVESAHDLSSLRRALGVEKLRLWASSYGTTLALAMLRYHGTDIDRAVLAGVEGPDDTLKLPGTAAQQLQAVTKLVAGDPSLSREIPNLGHLLTRLLAAAQTRPLVVPLRNSKSRTAVRVMLGRFDLEQLVIGMLGDRAGLERLPRTLLDIDRGRFSSPLVQEAAEEIIEERTAPIGSAMSFATDCASGASPQRLAQIERETRLGMLAHLDFPIPDVCPAWKVPELPPRDRTLVHSEVPTLFISGTLDGRTPPGNAEEVRRGFPNSRHILIEGGGHGNDLFVSSPDIQEVMVVFMKTGRLVKDRIQLPPLRFR
jgi:pimeloyl-ACP methyl ester carboxylesterase